MTASLHRLLAAAITGGGLLSAVAFFLPWVVVSCEETSSSGLVVAAEGAPTPAVGGDSMRLGSISPYERATGIEFEATGAIRPMASPEGIGPDARYFALLVGAFLIVVLGGLASIATTLPLRPIGAAAFLTGGAALAATVVIGLEEHLGVNPGQFPGAILRAEAAWGLWLAVAGNSVATAGGLLTLLVGRRPAA